MGAEGNFLQVYKGWETVLFYLCYLSSLSLLCIYFFAVLFLLFYLRDEQQCIGASDSSKTHSFPFIQHASNHSLYLWTELPVMCQPLGLPANK